MENQSPAYQQTAFASPSSQPQTTPGYSQDCTSENQAYPTNGISLGPLDTRPPRYNGGYQRLGNDDDPRQYQEHRSYLEPATSNTANSSTTVVVSQPLSSDTVAMVPYVEDNMTISILTCVFCCAFIGVFAIAKSLEARRRVAFGNYEGALASARVAKNVSIGAIIGGIWTYVILHFFIFNWSTELVN